MLRHSVDRRSVGYGATRLTHPTALTPALSRAREREGGAELQLAANFTSLMASKSWTPPPTRLVV